MGKINLNLIIGGTIISLYLIAAIVGLILGTQQIVVTQPLLKPSLAHLLGTDQLGRDIFLSIITASKNSIFVALVSSVLGVTIGTFIGIYSAYYGGNRAEFLNKTNEIVFAFPGLVLAILMCAVLGNNIFVCAIAIGIFNIPVFYRIAYSASLPLVGRENIVAAKIYSKPDYLIIVEHILPKIIPIISAQSLIQAALAVSAESALSYIGLGVQPPEPSWGRMIYDSQSWLEAAPQLALYPSLAILILVFGLNRLSDGIKGAKIENNNIKIKGDGK